MSLAVPACFFQIIDQASITSPKGFVSAGIHVGIRKRKRDLGVLICTVPATAAAVYTTNAFQAAPLKISQENINKEGKLQAIVVNSGVANACTGERGIEDAKAIASQAAQLLEIPAHYVGVASTGVIGQYLPMDKLTSGLEKVIPTANEAGGYDFAEAILTTDTFTKQVQVKLQVDGKEVTIAGAAKGSGMIHPNMATMLGFITTDAAIESNHLQLLLKETTDKTFNMITVDGDCSTNDSVFVMASGLAGNESLNPQHADWDAFQAAFTYVCQELAKKIAKDGEGATRLIEVEVTGASSRQMARKVAKAIVGSNLVKSAVFGADANWGRILCAAGYGEPLLRPEQVQVKLGTVAVVDKGLPVPFDETKASEILNQEKVDIHINLQQGAYQAVAWGCDLTYDYVKINASYRT
ncbi:bifunctional glutamate N-acetyltransferase/amino-acid acetyltransferase ArgJ [Shimazuella sp. AN120528]|uniref:bifunctional glutamate N-acetyltransferase/amino-acid acetyltransferase ArgJ n=1 Tax=Shimazuella soli TaxID=1892854 RepID=UPI001F10E33A|nr:bifunctional glutamate N-acetyltransferase/amino-acid acetyltransferase ArgJ [Shimazuella soli]MCH5585351.1 bifunctional glutamate N-acetyltransferase/amino-acid acetyltransferase ArgJ [Shimazuella soli]